MDTLGFITDCFRKRRVRWTYHVNLRMAGRTILREQILSAVQSFKIIESYPEDKYLPSYLVYAEHEGAVFHVLVAVDVPGENVRVVTAYRPSPDKWGNGLKTRRLT